MNKTAYYHPRFGYIQYNESWNNENDMFMKTLLGYKRIPACPLTEAMFGI